MRRHAERPRPWLGNVLAVGGALLAGVAVLTVQDLASDLRDANTARDQLAQQVQRLGASPVAGPPGSRGEPGEGEAGPAGVPGPTGPPGAPGPIGPTGPVGRTGPSGSPGADGVGTAGLPGADGQSVVGPAGPPGEAGPPGPAGPAGSPGADGTDGRDGADGKDGQTCPSGYSLQPPPTDPDALVCRRDSAPDAPDPATSPTMAALAPDRRRS